MKRSTEETDRDDRPPRHLKDEDGMVLRDNVFGTPEEDALRRDFTINALAYNIADFSVIDYSTGLSDLQQRLIRPIGDPSVRFTEDPVRMIRAVRFAASHDLTIEPATWETLCELSSTITRAAPARLYEEMLKLFLLGSARPVFTLLETSGLLAALFPGLGRWLAGNGDRRAMLHTNLECLDRLYRSGLPPSRAALSGRALRPRPGGGGACPPPRRHPLPAGAGCRMRRFPGRVLQDRLHPGTDRRSTAPHPRLSALAAPNAAATSRLPGRQARFCGRHVLPLSHGKDAGRKPMLPGMVGGLHKDPSRCGVEPPTEEAPAKRRRKRGRRRRPSAQPPPEIATECRLFPTTRTLKK